MAISAEASRIRAFVHAKWRKSCVLLNKEEESKMSKARERFLAFAKHDSLACMAHDIKAIGFLSPCLAFAIRLF